MPTALHAHLSALADEFATAVLDAIRGAPIEELLGQAGARAASGSRRAPVLAKGARGAASTGRLKRRSAQDISDALDQVHGLLKRHREGLRAEQIRDELSMQSKEMPRILAEGLTRRRLRKRGQKRATTYFAA